MTTTENDRLRKRLSELKNAKSKLLGQRVTISMDLLKEIDDVLLSEGTPSFDTKANSLANRFEEVNSLYDTIEKKLSEAISKTEDEIEE
jgi:chaperonin cofactor prefoldin